MKFKDLTPDFIKETYLFRIPIEFDNEKISDDAIQFYIDSAINHAEIALGIDIRKKEDIDENYDYRLEEWVAGYGYIQLNRRPVVRVKSISLNVITSEITIPNEWIKLKRKNGQINLIPYYGMLASASIGNHLLLFMPMLASTSYVPQILRCKYDSGYEPDDEIPNALAKYISNIASNSILNLLGEVALGGTAALAGYSIGIDGLHQSINTTASAENTAYSARVRTTERENEYLFRELKSYYYGIRLTAL